MSPQQILSTVMTHSIIYQGIYHPKPHSICFFLPKYQHQRNCFFFFFTRAWPRLWHKERASIVLTLSQSDWFIAQGEHFWLAITRRNSYHKNSELSKATAKLNIYSPKYNFNCSVTANIQAEFQGVAWHIHVSSVVWTL